MFRYRLGPFFIGRLVVMLGVSVAGACVHAYRAAVDWASYQQVSATVTAVDSTCALDARDGGADVAETDCGKLRTFYAGAGTITRRTTLWLRYVSPADHQPHDGLLQVTDDGRAGDAGPVPEAGRSWPIMAHLSEAGTIRPL